MQPYLEVLGYEDLDDAEGAERPVAAAVVEEALPRPLVLRRRLRHRAEVTPVLLAAHDVLGEPNLGPVLAPREGQAQGTRH